MEPIVWHARPALRDPVVVCAFNGWNDGGQAATLSARFLRQQLDAQRFCELDPDEFYDFQEVRPHVSLGGRRRAPHRLARELVHQAPLPSTTTSS